MGLRPRRRNLVVWSQSASPYWAPRDARLARPGRIRRWLRLGTVLILLGLLPLARAVRARWKPLLAGTVLTVAGYVLRGNEALGLLLMMPGLILLLTAPLLPGNPGAQRTELERELAGYWTNAQRHDLEATLDRYPDEVTHELREILAGQAAAGRERRVPAMGRR